MMEVKEVSHFLGGGVSSAFLQPHYLSLGLLVPHFISSLLLLGIPNLIRAIKH